MRTPALHDPKFYFDHLRSTLKRAFFLTKKIEQKTRAVETKDDHLTSGDQTVPKGKQGWFILAKMHYKFQAMITCGS